MKKITICLLLFLLFFSPFLINDRVEAETEADFIGGYLFYNSNLEEFNEMLTSENETLENNYNHITEDEDIKNELDQNDLTDLLNYESFEEITNLDGFYIGQEYMIDTYFDKATVLYERIETEKRASFNTTNALENTIKNNYKPYLIQMDSELDLTLNSINLGLENIVSKYLSLKTGASYTWGNGEWDTTKKSLSTGEYSTTDKKREISGKGNFGWNIGAELSYPIEENIFFNTSLGYRFSEMKINIEDENGHQIESFTENLSGARLNVGISFKM